VTFDLTTTTPARPSNDPDQLPESGMGLFIIGSFVDSIAYLPGELGQRANELRLVKRFAAVAEAVSAGAHDEPELPEPPRGSEQATRAGK
jgi:serine/threonine-protein kinase RsbW